MIKIGFIGCGNMASAMIGGILGKGLLKPEEILASCLTEENARKKEAQLGIRVGLDNGRTASEARVLILAVKPQFYEEVLCQIRPVLTPEHLLVGIAPGKTMEWISRMSGGLKKTARLMPNTPAQVGEGITAMCTSDSLSEEDTDFLKAVAESFGKCIQIPERLMDVAGAVGGCSPAYVYMFIEAMADAAVAQGMSRAMAVQFASQAVLGSAKMVLETGLHPGELKDMVCSPGGSTIQGVRALEKAGFRGAVFEALTASAEKGKTL